MEHLKIRIVVATLALVGVAACKKKEASTPALDRSAAVGSASADAALGADAAVAPVDAASAATTVPTLENSGIGGLTSTFKGGLPELHKALPGLAIDEAAIPFGEGEVAAGYEVKSGEELLFTLTPESTGVVTLEATSPQVKTADGLHVGSTFEELVAVKRTRTCKGIEAEGYFAECHFEKDSITYEVTLDKEPPSGGAKLDQMLAGKAITAIRWAGKADLAVPSVAHGNE